MQAQGMWSAGDGDDNRRFLADLRALRDTAALEFDELAALAEVRCAAGVQVALDDARAWVSWQPGDERVLRLVLPVPGVRLFVRRDGCWYRLGRRLPDFAFPADLEYRPLANVLVPAPVAVTQVPATQPGPCGMRLVADGKPRTATALACPLVEAARWADGVVKSSTARRAVPSRPAALRRGARPKPMSMATSWALASRPACFNRTCKPSDGLWRRRDRP